MTRPMAALSAVALALAACRMADPSATAGRPCLVDAGEGNRSWYAGSEADQRRLAAWIDALGTARGEDLLDLGRKILSRGEAAVPPLVVALRSENPERRGQAAYLLGWAQDRRILPALADATKDPVRAVRYEAAGALLELRDPRGLPVLVEGLEDPDARLRAKCLSVLAEKTGQRLGFEADGAPDDRAAAVRRWRLWLGQRGAAGG